MEMAEKVGKASISGRLSFKTMINENEGKEEQELSDHCVPHPTM